MSEVKHTPNRFRITYRGGAYFVSIPRYHGGEVVKAGVVDELVKAAQFARSVLAANPMELSERMAIEQLDAALALAEGAGNE